MKKNLFNTAITIIFTIFLSLSFIGLSLGMTSKIDNTEWRQLNEFPKINSGIKLSQFPKKFEDFYNDNFGFRNILLNVSATIMFKVFNQSPVDKYSIKTDKDWYFHNEARYVKPNYKYYYDHIIFSDKQLAAISDIFLAEKIFLDQKNIRYLYVIVPDKEVVYPEYYPFPNFINANIQTSQILSALNKRGIPTLFLGSQMIEAKKATDLLVYQKHDPHWNQLGAFFGYQAVVNKLKEYFPSIESLQLSDFNITIKSDDPKRKYDLNTLKSLIKTPNEATEEKDEQVGFYDKEDVPSKLNKINKVIVYGDSFFRPGVWPYTGGVLYFLKNNFKNTEVFLLSIGKLDKTLIEKEKPDIFIRETVQRNLYRLIDDLPADLR